MHHLLTGVHLGKRGWGEMKQVTEVGLGNVPHRSLFITWSSQVFCDFYLKFGNIGYTKTDKLAAQIHCNIFKISTVYGTTTISGYARRRDIYKSLNYSALWKCESRSSAKQISGTLMGRGRYACS